MKTMTLLLLMGIPLGMHAQQSQELTEEQQLLQVMHSIESQVLFSWVDTLASERFEGRLTGTVGNPQMAVTDASLVVRLPGHEHPLLDVDAMDLDMEIQFEADTPVLKLAPMKVFDHQELTKQRSEVR